MTGGIISERNLLTMEWDTRKGKVCKTNVRSCAAKRLQKYKGIKVDKPYNVKISERRGERTRVKQFVYLKGYRLIHQKCQYKEDEEVLKLNEKDRW